MVIVLATVMILIALLSGLLMLWRIPVMDKDEKNEQMSGIPDVTLIIPAYNEAQRLPPLLQSVREQDYQPSQLLVIDDFSTDETAAIAKKWGARVICSQDLSPGWIGKSRACWTGALNATADWLVFLDADTRLDKPDSLRRLAWGFARKGACGILSVQPYHTIEKLYENFSALFNIILMAGMNLFTPLGNRIPGAGAFGPCIVCRKEQYFASGGHQAIRGAVLDDLELGQSFRHKGWPVHCYGGQGLIHFQMYPEGFARLFEGWTKNFGAAANSTHPLIISMIILWIGGGFSAPALLCYTALARPGPALFLAACLYLIYYLQLIWLSRRVGRFDILFLFFYPLLYLFFTVLFIWSLFKTRIRHSVRWRGRDIDV